MICKWCSECAAAKTSGKLHTDVPKALKDEGHACPGGTWCDCQHREPGTAVNKELVKDG